MDARCRLWILAFALLSCGGRASSPENEMRASGGAAPATGGAPSSDDPRRCNTTADCTRCIYAKAAASQDDCATALGCCGGPVTNIATCSANEAAFLLHCSDREYEPPQCPCISPGLCAPEDTPSTIACRDAQCGFGCPE